MTEGGLQAPTRHAIAWQDPDYFDPVKVEAELRRVFDICHGCRRCFNLCDSFPRLFDLIDESSSGELDSVNSKDFRRVIEGCTLCDLCFMTKCPYVPPHAFALDFPHLMLRARAAEARAHGVPRDSHELAKMDRNGKLAGMVAPLANWASATGNTLTRPLLERVAHLHRDADLPRFASRSFVAQAAKNPPVVNTAAPAYGRKAVLYATCSVNYNEPEVGLAARAVLAKNGVTTEVVHPHCCGMPLLELGCLDEVAAAARVVAGGLRKWIDDGYDVIALVPSCALMMKFEWPLILPGDDNVAALSRATRDVSEYVVEIARKEGLVEGMRPVPGGVAVQIPCHARAQNMGQKAAELLRLLPEADVHVVERCCGHGGSWGCRTENFEVALKVGRPVAREMRDAGKEYITSECPLAGVHIRQGIEKLGEGPRPTLVRHPVQLMARAYGIGN